jgi:hypothetical protein
MLIKLLNFELLNLNFLIPKLGKGTQHGKERFYYSTGSEGNKNSGEVYGVGAEMSCNFKL